VTTALVLLDSIAVTVSWVVLLTPTAALPEIAIDVTVGVPPPPTGVGVEGELLLQAAASIPGLAHISPLGVSI
jgi:hypothetical protein